MRCGSRSIAVKPAPGRRLLRVVAICFRFVPGSSRVDAGCFRGFRAGIVDSGVVRRGGVRTGAGVMGGAGGCGCRLFVSLICGAPVVVRAMAGPEHGGRTVIGILCDQPVRAGRKTSVHDAPREFASGPPASAPSGRVRARAALFRGRAAPRPRLQPCAPPGRGARLARFRGGERLCDRPNDGFGSFPVVTHSARGCCPAPLRGSFIVGGATSPDQARSAAVMRARLRAASSRMPRT